MQASALATSAVVAGLLAVDGALDIANRHPGEVAGTFELQEGAALLSHPILGALRQRCRRHRRAAVSDAHLVSAVMAMKVMDVLAWAND